MPNPSDPLIPTRLRKQMRARRQALPRAQRDAAGAALCRRLTSDPRFGAARRIAGYLPVGGEIDPRGALEHALDDYRSAWVPVLAGETLLFAAWEPGVALQPNRYGIPEPPTTGQRLLEPAELDLVLAPLVAFDRRGGRLGMGGGYYDRAFEFILQRAPGPRPLLVGVAYAFQEVPALESNPWDVPLDAVATDAGWIDFEEGG